MDDTTTRFNLAVELALKAAGINKSQVAQALALDRKTVGRKLSGRNDWSLGEVHTVGQLLGVKPAQLIDGTLDWIVQLRRDGADAVLGRLAAIVNQRPDQPNEGAETKRKKTGT